MKVNELVELALAKKAREHSACSRKPNDRTVLGRCLHICQMRPPLGHGGCPARWCNTRVLKQLAPYEGFMLLRSRAAGSRNVISSVGLVCAPIAVPSGSALDSGVHHWLWGWNSTVVI